MRTSEPEGYWQLHCSSAPSEPEIRNRFCGRMCAKFGAPEHDPEKACPGLDPGWLPVFGKDHAPARPRVGCRIEEKSSHSRAAFPAAASSGDSSCVFAGSF